MEDEFADAIKSRGDDFKFFQDQYGEHPDERAVKNEELTEKLGDIQTLTNIYGGLKDKVGWRKQYYLIWTDANVLQFVVTCDKHFGSYLSREHLVYKAHTTYNMTLYS